MGKSKIIYNDKTLIDLTSDTVTADTLRKGVTAHGKDGEPITGIFEGITPTGNINITANGEYDVTEFAKAIVNVASGIIPIGNLTDSLITRASTSNGHSATIPEGYYVNSAFTISEWKAGQITGSGTSSGTFTIPYSSIGFIPTWAIIFANSINLLTDHTVLFYFSTASAARSIYTYAKSSLGTYYEVNTGASVASFSSNGVTFPAISSVKYGTSSYRWFALR